MKYIVLCFLFPLQAFSITPLSADSIQLQSLINKSEQQIQTLKIILDQTKKDTKTLERVAATLDQINYDLDQSLEQYRGTDVYNKALIQSQKMNDFKSVYEEGQKLREMQSLMSHNIEENNVKNYKNIIQFQKDTVKANQEDLKDQKELEDALLTAKMGFIPKIQAQAQLQNWKTNTRLSVQITELLATLHSIREELRAMRLKDSDKDLIGILIKGSEQQNQKLRNKESQ